jgi:hypothetical protein
MIAPERAAAVSPTPARVPPAVTAVVPTHRRPELMARAVESILAQTYAGEIEVCRV